MHPKTKMDDHVVTKPMWIVKWLLRYNMDSHVEIKIICMTMSLLD